MLEKAPQPLGARRSMLKTVLIFVQETLLTLVRGVLRQIVGVLNGFETWLTITKKARYGLAVTRILFGCTALGILLTHWNTRLYTFGAGAAWTGEIQNGPISDFPKIWIFSAFHQALLNNTVFTALYILLAVLSVTLILGWRFRITGPLFWVMWVSFSEVNDFQGDQSANLIRIALLFMLFADPAGRWSLDARRRARRATKRSANPELQQVSNAFHNLVVIAIGAQVILVYLSGAFYKTQGESWRSGVAVYETLSVERYNTWPFWSELFIQWGPLVALASVGTLAIQALFGVMLLHRTTRVIALLGMLVFHLGIGILMGLPWFSLIMFGVDAIFIRDKSWEAMIRAIRTRWNESRRYVMT